MFVKYFQNINIFFSSGTYFLKHSERELENFWLEVRLQYLRYTVFKTLAYQLKFFNLFKDQSIF